MAENRNNSSPPDNSSYLREIRDAVVGIQDILSKNQATVNQEGEIPKNIMYVHHKQKDVYLSKEVVLGQLKVCESTLAKWRYKQLLEYMFRGSRQVVYSYVSLMDALAEDRLTARGFNSFTAYKRMLGWYRNNIESSDKE
jgi:hypothetical protein